MTSRLKALAKRFWKAIAGVAGSLTATQVDEALDLFGMDVPAHVDTALATLVVFVFVALFPSNKQHTDLYGDGYADGKAESSR